MPSPRFKLKGEKPKEADHQGFLFDYIDKVGQHRWPELKWTFAVPNYSGRYNFATHAWYLAQGKRPGVPDVCVPTPKWTGNTLWCALYIEFKRSKSETLTVEQEGYRDYLISAGYAWARCNSGPEAVAVVESYMEGRFEQ